MSDQTEPKIISKNRICLGGMFSQDLMPACRAIRCRCSSLRGPFLRQKSGGGGGRKGGSAINSLIVRFNLVPECAVFLALLEDRMPATLSAEGCHSESDTMEKTFGPLPSSVPFNYSHVVSEIIRAIIRSGDTKDKCFPRY